MIRKPSLRRAFVTVTMIGVMIMARQVFKMTKNNNSLGKSTEYFSSRNGISESKKSESHTNTPTYPKSGAIIIRPRHARSKTATINLQKPSINAKCGYDVSIIYTAISLFKCSKII